MLVETDQISRKNSGISKMLNNYFVNRTDELRIYNWVEQAVYYWKLTRGISLHNYHPKYSIDQE